MSSLSRACALIQRPAKTPFGSRFAVTASRPPTPDCARTAPVHGRDIIAGYANRPPFFYGLDGEINGLLNGKGAIDLSVKQARQAYLGTTEDVELGSNALAVSPLRAADGHTRLAVNSHQPYTGTVAWYETRLKSEEGIDMVGGFLQRELPLIGGGGFTDPKQKFRLDRAEPFGEDKAGRQPIHLRYRRGEIGPASRSQP